MNWYISQFWFNFDDRLPDPNFMETTKSDETNA